MRPQLDHIQRMLLSRQRAVATLGGAAFSPVTLFGVSDTGGCWNPSVLSSVWQDSVGGTPASLNGEMLAISDLSGKANHASGVKGPTLKTSGGLYWSEFDGVDDLLSATFTHNQPVDRIMAFRQITWTNDETLWDGTTANRCRIYQRPTTPSLRAFAGSTEIELGSTPTVGTDFVLTERWNGASSQWAFNNGSYITENPGTANPGGLLLGAFGNGAAEWSNFRFLWRPVDRTFSFGW